MNGLWIHIIKHERLMHIKKDSTVIKTYRIALGKVPIGKKQFEGDQKTPEGEYLIDDKSAQSKFYKNLGVSYPNELDKQNAITFGKSAGGLIKIHGFPNDYIGNQEEGKLTDWTEGCIAVTNSEMDELYNHIDVGTIIRIDP